MFYKKTFLIIFCALFILGLVNSVNAAKLYFISEAENFGVGDEFYVDLKVDTEDVDINAAEVQVLFQNNILELLSVEKDSSIFNFWLEGPNISNEDGKVDFIGGTSKGVFGSSLQILRLNFRANGSGITEITAVDTVVTASDGKGTNVLSVIEGISIGIGVEIISPESAEMPEVEEGVSREQPVIVERDPVIAQDKPEEPELTSPLYPDPSKWYNHLGEVIVFWEVPDDIIKIATDISHDPNGDPQTIEDTLFTGKKFSILEEGVWYSHIQFKNNVGWGKIAHYQILIDTTPPIPFEIEIDNEQSDNPTPEINYETHDILSGIAEYSVFIDGQSSISTSSSSMALLPQAPGKHTVTIRAIDFAGNGIEDDLNFEILPILTPTISFITKSITQEEFVFASGKTIVNGFVDVRILNKTGQKVFLRGVKSDNLGNWEIVVEEPLVTGEYTVIINARDDRGAISYPIEQALKVKARTIISIGGFINLGWFEIFLIIVLLIVSGVSITAWYYLLEQKKRHAFNVIAGRDIDKLSKLLADDLKQLKKIILNSSDSVFSYKGEVDIKHFIKGMEANIAKMKKYLREGIRKLK